MQIQNANQRYLFEEQPNETNINDLQDFQTLLNQSKPLFRFSPA